MKTPIDKVNKCSNSLHLIALRQYQCVWAKKLESIWPTFHLIGREVKNENQANSHIIISRTTLQIHSFT